MKWHGVHDSHSIETPMPDFKRQQPASFLSTGPLSGEVALRGNLIKLCVALLMATVLIQSPHDLVAQETGFDSSRFEVITLASGLIRPMELAVAPDGRVFLIELDGKLKVYDPSSATVSEVATLTVTTEQENGLIGIALDPGFATNHWIYLQYSPPDFPGQHISRFTLQGHRLDLDSEKLLLKFEEQRKECCHHAGALEFGPDGCLYIGTGDNTHPHGDSQGFAPIDERPGKAPWDAQKSSANNRSYSGKILRIRPTPEGGYEIPEGNLFPPDGSAGHPEIFAMGCRNPWRLNVDQKTGFVYWGEVGPDAQNDGPRGPRGYDEINQARRAGNFGWPYFIANNQAYAEVDFATGEVGPRYDVTGPTNNSPNNTGSQLLPAPTPAFIYYPYAASAEFPELGSGGRTACAGPVYDFDPQSQSNTRFPSHFDRSLFIYEWTRHWIKVVHLDDESNIRSIEPFMPEHKFVRPIDLQFGPEGSLYLIEYGETWGVNPDARLVRIDYVRGNRAPVAVADAKGNIGPEPLTVQFSSEGTSDKDGNDTLTYAWVATRAGQAPEVLSRERAPELTFESPGVYTVELQVTDPAGAMARASVPVIVGNAAPQVTLRQPVDGDFFDPGQSIRFELYVNDREDGTSDFDEADRLDLPEIDNLAASRAAVDVSFRTGPLPGSAALNSDEGPAGFQLMKRSDCFNCHAVNRKRVGPPLLEVSRKYRDKPDALEASAKRVLGGSTGVWGKIPMIPHAQHTLEEAREMVAWIYSLRDEGSIQVFEGFVGAIPADKPADQSGYYLLQARYTDRGNGEIPPLSGSAEVYVRSRRIEAESADQIQGPQILNSGNAMGEKFIGAINHGHFLRFRNLPLQKTRRVTARIASAGAGGEIEFRAGAPNGRLLGRMPVDVNGNWEDFYERTVDLEEAKQRDDLFVVFTNREGRSGLMNLDSLYFHPLTEAANP